MPLSQERNEKERKRKEKGGFHDQRAGHNWLKGDFRQANAEETEDHLHHRPAQRGACKAAVPSDCGLLRYPSAPPLPAQDRAAFCR